MNEFNKKAFDIGELPENIDLDAPPVTGFDYLYRVRLETKNCPKVVVSDIDTTQFICHQTVKFDFCNGFVRASPGFEPDSNWQDDVLSSFTKIRDERRRHDDLLKSKFPAREMPNLSNRSSWCKFCLGKDRYAQICGKKEIADREEDDSPKRKRTRVCNEGNPPYLSFMLYLNQGDIMTLIKYHVEWLKVLKFTHNQGEWLYALLVCLQKPLAPDACDLLRSLSRICSSLRSDILDPEDEALVALNMLITIISHYFDQRDMSDDFFNEEPA